VLNENSLTGSLDLSNLPLKLLSLSDNRFSGILNINKNFLTGSCNDGDFQVQTKCCALVNIGDEVCFLNDIYSVCSTDPVNH
ncbi:hypothetical protein HDU92_000196, partial [Lobulomyces angularis]